jgi:hypothetical protein
MAETGPKTDQDRAWTGPRDARLRRLRLEGATWAEIAAELGVTPAVARERARRIGAPRGAPAAAARATEDPHRPPLPPGHPRAWAVLTEGTTLAGTAWPGWQ